MPTATEIPDIATKSEHEIAEFRARLNQSNLGDEDKELAGGCLDLALWLPEVPQQQKITIKQLRELIFGADSNQSPKKNQENKGQESESNIEGVGNNSDDNTSGNKKGDSQSDKKGKSGHGRRGNQDYRNATDVYCHVADHACGDACPGGCGGKLYKVKKAGVVIRITGNSLGMATRYHLEKLRCALCGLIITAQLPTDVRKQPKYDAKFKAKLCLQKYYIGVPFYRQEKFQELLGFPLPSSTQFELCEQVADIGYRVFDVLEQYGANGDIIQHDDTFAKILSILSDNKADLNKPRKGMYTTAILSKTIGAHQVALFYAGEHHGGENLSQLLANRVAEKKKVIQMCDALAANMPKELQTIICNCLAHGFRKFRDLLEYYPEPCLHVMQILGEVYRNDEQTKQMDPHQRLLYHRKHSKPLMLKLHGWLNKQLSNKVVEPNSHLGKAMKYMLKHWKKLRRFLTTPGAPLDNNIVEAILKIPIRIRKAAMFYKTQHGANIGSILLSLIVTAQLCGENPLDYLVALQENKSSVFKEPSLWLPWNYQIEDKGGLVDEEAA